MAVLGRMKLVVTGVTSNGFSPTFTSVVSWMNCWEFRQNITDPLPFLGRDSTVVIATRYVLDGRGIESLWGRYFPHQSRPALGTTQPPVQGVPRLIPRGKATGAWR